MKIDRKKITEYIKNNKMTVFAFAFLAASVLVIIFFGKITFEHNDSSFFVDAWFASEIEVPFDKVDSVSLSEEIDTGSRKSGMETGRVFVGTFQNTKYGSYSLYAYKNVKEYITVTFNGGTLVFNCSSEEKTIDAYYLILSKIKPKNDAE
ncbi:MAG: hypothetical protein IJS94_00855 [Clostridia bacterium]|nr:hypothetical protein [Clostridia bacterium]